MITPSDFSIMVTHIPKGVPNIKERLHRLFRERSLTEYDQNAR
jgi:hypothetical protein